MSSNLTGSTAVSDPEHRIGDSVLQNRKEVIPSETPRFKRRLTYPELRFDDPDLNEIVYGEKQAKESKFKRFLKIILCQA
ncbi:MAG: hypothetical protein M5F18_07390 [Asgard group archaeon]|nr:hypothetical protein JTP64_004537 [Candida tropicalis]MCP8719104.1 hypothetical protein [Asgard group archaeon]